MKTENRKSGYVSKRILTYLEKYCSRFITTVIQFPRATQYLMHINIKQYQRTRQKHTKSKLRMHVFKLKVTKFHWPHSHC